MIKCPKWWVLGSRAVLSAMIQPQGSSSSREERESGWLSMSYLSCPLEVCKVNIRDEENRLRVKIRHCLEVSDVTLLLQRYCCQLAISS